MNSACYIHLLYFKLLPKELQDIIFNTTMLALVKDSTDLLINIYKKNIKEIIKIDKDNVTFQLNGFYRDYFTTFSIFSLKKDIVEIFKKIKYIYSGYCICWLTDLRHIDTLSCPICLERGINSIYNVFKISTNGYYNRVILCEYCGYNPSNKKFLDIENQGLIKCQCWNERFLDGL